MLYAHLAAAAVQDTNAEGGPGMSVGAAEFLEGHGGILPRRRRAWVTDYGPSMCVCVCVCLCVCLCVCPCVLYIHMLIDLVY